MAVVFKYAFILILPSFTVNGEIFSSIECLQDLVKFQHGLFTDFQNAVDNKMDAMSEFAINLQSWLHSEADIASTQWTRNDHEIAGHPIVAFNLVKQWTKVKAILGEHLYKILVDLAVVYHINLSESDSDYQGALAALVRLQRTYLLPARDLAQGRVYNVTSSRGMDHADCLQMATLLMDVDHSLADSWLDLLLEESEDTSLRAHAYKYKLEIYEKCNDAEGAYHSAQQVLALDPDPDLSVQSAVTRLEETRNLTQRSPKIGTPTQYWRNIETDELTRYRSVCRGEELSNSLFVNKDLVCLYRGGILPYVTYKEEIHSYDPRISLIYDVITDEQVEMLKRKAFPGLFRGRVMRDDAEKVSEVRTGQMNWLWDTDPDVARVSARVADVTGLSTELRDQLSDAEALQVFNYGLGGHYGAHFDYLTEQQRTSLPSQLMGTGDRIATFMFYLSDVQAEGATVFPNIRVKLPAKKNAAAFWYNFRLSGEEDPRTLHGGCPVLLGQKWISNKWIRQLGQTFRRPCGLTEDAILPMSYQ